ncbi:hypothetical protein BDZ91DRAFT_202272 [Kalaharituber pfeilii]|nr:hypothetical protein BDZ91DRAFT_202272 [Kalaharituber pfeilii]
MATNPEPVGGPAGGPGLRQSLKGVMHDIKYGIKASFRKSDNLSPPLDRRLSRSRPKSPVGTERHSRTSSAPPSVNTVHSQSSGSSNPVAALAPPAPLQLAQTQTVDDNSVSGSSHSPKQQHNVETSVQPIQPQTTACSVTAPVIGSLQSPREHSVVPQIPLQNLQSNKIHGNIELIIETLQCAKDDVKKRQWQYTNRRGERIVVVEQLGRILKGVQHYASIVDVAIQHSPETTALVWAGVRFILQVSLNVLPHGDIVNRSNRLHSTILN